MLRTNEMAGGIITLIMTPVGDRGQFFSLGTGGSSFPGGHVANGGKVMLCAEVGMGISTFQRRGGRQH